jgi:hypothetical protein
MLPMNFANQSPPADVCLLLRAHAEARWLSREVVPVIRELEHELASGTALAYLEALRIEAHHHAGETDAARSELDALGPGGDHGVRANAHRYHAAVRELRATIDARVQQLLAAAGEVACTAGDSEQAAVHGGTQPQPARARNRTGRQA